MRNIMKDNYRLVILITFDITSITENDVEYILDTIFELFLEDIDIQFGVNSIKIQCDTDMEMNDYVEILDIILGTMKSCQIVIKDTETNNSFFKSYFNLEYENQNDDDYTFNLQEFGSNYLNSVDVKYDLDDILDKINISGMESLTEGELNFLKKIK